MKILFTHSYFYPFDAKQWALKKPYPPYGTIYAAALMRQAGYEVALLDTNLRHDPADILPILAQQEPQYLVIYDDGFNYLTKMCLTKMREAAFELAKFGKQYACTVIICSSDSTDHFDKYLDHDVDFVIIGEGEETLKELIQTLEKKRTAETSDIDYLAIKGIVYRQNGASIKTPKRPVLRQLDDLPDPAWDLVDIKAYQQIWKQHGYFSLNLATTRGCPFKCNWCAKPIYGNRYNSRSPQRVADEIERLVKQYGATHFWMADDIFGLKPNWVQEFRAIVLEKQLTFKYKVQSRVDLLLQADTIDALVASGLDEVWVGAESGSQKILDAMDKGTKVEQIYQATRLLQEKGVKVCFFLQFGYLGETKADIDQTIQMVLDLLPDDIGISVSYPLPETLFYEKVKASFQHKENWTDSDDLDMLFTGTFSKAYYRQLHRYVHKRFRQHQGYQQLKQLLQKPTQVSWKQLKAVGSILYYTPTAWQHQYQLKQLEKLERV